MNVLDAGKSRPLEGGLKFPLPLGRLHFKKGLDRLILAFDALRQRVPGVQLVIAGPENDDYGQRVRGWVREHGVDARRFTSSVPCTVPRCWRPTWMRTCSPCLPTPRISA